MRFQDKVVIVTGAAQGIGLACARAFAEEGARVLLCDVDPEKGAAAADAINGAGGGSARFQPCDVGDRAQAEAAVRAAVEGFGRLDVLVNNAGIIHTADLLDLEEADFDRVLRVNLKGPFLMGQAAARAMAAAAAGGAIVNVSSVNGVVAIPNQIPYAVSKGGLNQLTKVMALALAPHGIRVNGVGPGSILTDMLKVVMTDEAARAKILSRTPLGRPGEPAEVARVVLFVASDDASYLTGQTIYPDGGRLALNYTVPVPE